MAWYYLKDGKPIGPISSEELKALAKSGAVTRGTEIRNEHTAKWYTADKVRGLWEADAAQVSEEKDEKQEEPSPLTSSISSEVPQFVPSSEVKTQASLGWFYLSKIGEVGPFSPERLQYLVTIKQVFRSTPVRFEGTSSYVNAEQILGIEWKNPLDSGLNGFLEKFFSDSFRWYPCYFLLLGSMLAIPVCSGSRYWYC